MVGRFRFGVPRTLEFAGCDESPEHFARAIAALEALGGERIELDFEPFVAAAKLLYEGPWVAERYSVAGTLMETHPDAVLPVIRAVLAQARSASALDTFRAQYRLQELKATCDAMLETLDCVLTPTIPRPVTLDELARDPVGANSLLGHYTNFMNLLDYAAVAVPTGVMRNGLPWGVTLFGRAFTDQYLLSVADALQRAQRLRIVGGASSDAGRDALASRARHDRMRLVVCGAHLDGLPLNSQLTQRGGRLVATTSSAPHYRLYALAGGAIPRPGLVRAEHGGAAIAVEVWELPSAEIGSLLAGIPAPLGLGRIELADSSVETGFICESQGLADAVDITHFGGWRAWLAHLGIISHGPIP